METVYQHNQNTLFQKSRAHVLLRRCTPLVSSAVRIPVHRHHPMMSHLLHRKKYKIMLACFKLDAVGRRCNYLANAKNCDEKNACFCDNISIMLHDLSLRKPRCFKFRFS